MMQSQMLHLDGTNEASTLRAPTTLFVNSDNQADQSYSSIDSHQTDVSDEPYQESPTEDNTYNTAYSSLFGNEMEDYNVDNNDNNNVALKDDDDQAPYDEQSNEEYLNQDSREDQSAPARTMVPDFNNYQSNYVSNAGVQGGLIPTLSSLIASRIRAINRLNLLGQTHHTSNLPNYASFVKQILKTKARESKKFPRLPSYGNASEAAKKDNTTKSHNQTQQSSATDKIKAKIEDNEKEELQYKNIVKNAEMAANLAEAAKTLTKLVKKLTAQDAMISEKQEGEPAKPTHNNEGL